MDALEQSVLGTVCCLLMGGLDHSIVACTHLGNGTGYDTGTTNYYSVVVRRGMNQCFTVVGQALPG